MASAQLASALDCVPFSTWTTSDASIAEIEPRGDILLELRTGKVFDPRMLGAEFRAVIEPKVNIAGLVIEYPMIQDLAVFFVNEALAFDCHLLT